MTSLKLALTGLGAVVLLSACSTMSDRTQDLSLGMSKQQVIKVLGKDFTTVGAQASSVNGQVEVLSYKDDNDGDVLVYFRDGKLVQWGDTAELANIPQ